MRVNFQKFLNNKIVLISVGFLGMLSCGSIYSVGLFSQNVKEILQYNQATIEILVSITVSLISIVSPVCGHMVDSYGPRITSLLAALSYFIGYGVFSFVLYWRTSLAQVLAFFVFPFVGLGVSFLYLSIYGSVGKILNVGENAGIYLSVLIGGYGLGASVISLLYKVILHGHGTSRLLLLVAVFSVSISLMCAFILPQKREKSYEQLRSRERSDSINIQIQAPRRSQKQEDSQTLQEKQHLDPVDNLDDYGVNNHNNSKQNGSRNNNSSSYTKRNNNSTNGIKNGKPVLGTYDDGGVQDVWEDDLVNDRDLAKIHDQGDEEVTIPKRVTYQDNKERQDKQRAGIQGDDQNQASSIDQRNFLEMEESTFKQTLLQLLRMPTFYYCTGSFVMLIASSQLIMNNVGVVVQAFEHRDKSQMNVRVQNAVIFTSVINFASRIFHGVLMDKVQRGKIFILYSTWTILLVSFVSFMQAQPHQYAYAIVLLVGQSFAYGSLWTLFPLCILDIFGKIKNSTVLGCVMICIFPANMFLHAVLGAFIDRYQKSDNNTRGYTMIPLQGIQSTFYLNIVFSITALPLGIYFLKSSSVPQRNIRF